MIRGHKRITAFELRDGVARRDRRKTDGVWLGNSNKQQQVPIPSTITRAQWRCGWRWWPIVHIVTVVGVSAVSALSPLPGSDEILSLCHSLCLPRDTSLSPHQGEYLFFKWNNNSQDNAFCKMYVLCDMSLCLTVTPPESGSESWCYSYNLHPSVSFNKICKTRKDDAMQVHFRLLLIFLLTLVSKLPPYSSRLNPAQGPVAWCLQWPGTRHSLNFPRSSDSWWCAGLAEPGDLSVRIRSWIRILQVSWTSGHKMAITRWCHLWTCQEFINCEMSAHY